MNLGRVRESVSAYDVHLGRRSTTGSEHRYHIRSSDVTESKCTRHWRRGRTRVSIYFIIFNVTDVSTDLEEPVPTTVVVDVVLLVRMVEEFGVDVVVTTLFSREWSTNSYLLFISFGMTRSTWLKLKLKLHLLNLMLLEWSSRWYWWMRFDKPC